MDAATLAIDTLGPCRIDSPLKSLIESRQTTEHYVEETDRVLFHDTLAQVGGGLFHFPDLVVQG